MELFKLMEIFALMGCALVQGALDPNAGDQQSQGGAPMDTTTSVAGTQASTGHPWGPAERSSNPPQVPQLDCSLYTCTDQQSVVSNPLNCNGNGDNPPGQMFTCNYKFIKDTTECYGVYCMHIEDGNEYCICTPDQVGAQCSAFKPGRCDAATGLLPSTSYSVSNKRYRNRAKPDAGNVYARHFATSGTDCIRLCQWAMPSCQSVNYGPSGGQQLCELLSVTVTNGSIMQPWLTDAPGWTYTTVTGRLAAV